MTNAELELLAHLAEECSELIHICMKTIRHGFESTHPEGGPTNRVLLNEEAGDVHHLILRAGRNGLLNLNQVLPMNVEKALERQKYIHCEENKA